MARFSRTNFSLQGIFCKYLFGKPKNSMKLSNGVMNNTNDRQSILRYFWLMAAFLFVLVPVVASAEKPPKIPHHNRDIIRQLDVIESTLADLSNQILDSENRSIGQLDNIESTLADLSNQILDSENRSNARLDMLQGDLFFLVAAAESQEQDITIATTLCFGISISNELAVGGNVEAGAGWPNVAHVELKAMIDAKLFGLESGIAEEICIEVPLHTITSAPLPEFINTTDFDDLISDIVLPSQAVIPLVGTLYTAVMPSKLEVMAATENVIVAATGINIRTGALGSPNPQMLLRPDLLFAPIIAPYQGFINGIPIAVATITADPCGVLENSVLQIDTSGFGLICDIGPDFVHFVINIVDPFHLLHPIRGGI